MVKTWQGSCTHPEDTAPGEGSGVGTIWRDLSHKVSLRQLRGKQLETTVEKNDTVCHFRKDNDTE